MKTKPKQLRPVAANAADIGDLVTCCDLLESGARFSGGSDGLRFAYLRELVFERSEPVEGEASYKRVK